VDIDKILLDRLRDEALAEGISFRAILNRTIRRGLETPTRRVEAYACPTFSMGAPLRPLDKALGLADALEDDETARALSQRR
jgi:hypothetical protein